MARQATLQTECVKFSSHLKSFMDGKETFLTDLVRALKRTTDELKTWNHRVFGGVKPRASVASVDQVSNCYSNFPFSEMCYAIQH